jgi:hypothetical protein
MVRTRKSVRNAYMKFEIMVKILTFNAAAGTINATSLIPMGVIKMISQRLQRLNENSTDTFTITNAITLILRLNLLRRSS